MGKMPVMTIVYCDECGFKKHADLLKGFIVETMKSVLDEKKTTVACMSSQIKGTFNVFLSDKALNDVDKVDDSVHVIHNKQKLTNGFGLFSNKEHVLILKHNIEKFLLA